MIVHFYLGMFFVLLALLPICLVATIAKLSRSPAFWIASLLWPLAIAASALFANHLCSSERMRYRDGLLWVTNSMMTGWLYMSFATVLPGLLFAFPASVYLALRGQFGNHPGYSQREWHRLVSYFYRHRMKQ
jgi:hypothetical protein